MRGYLRLALPAAALMFLFSSFAVSAGKAQTVLPEILNRMDEHQKALTSLKASVAMNKYNAQLEEHDLYEGKVNYLPAAGRDALVRLDWTSPYEETLSIVNKQYILCRPRLKECIIGTVENATQRQQDAGTFEFLNMSKAELKANYSLVYLGKEEVRGGIPTWRLQLTPKISQSYKLAELWVDGNGMALQAKIIEKNDDSTTFLLSELEKNADINAAIFRIKPPKDWKVTKS